MSILYAIAGWGVFVSIVEIIMWRIFYKRTIKISFLTEPDLPLSRYFTIAAMRFLAITHASMLILGIIFTYILLW